MGTRQRISGMTRLGAALVLAAGVGVVGSTGAGAATQMIRHPLGTVGDTAASLVPAPLPIRPDPAGGPVVGTVKGALEGRGGHRIRQRVAAEHAGTVPGRRRSSSSPDCEAPRPRAPAQRPPRTTTRSSRRTLRARPARGLRAAHPFGRAGPDDDRRARPEPHRPAHRGRAAPRPAARALPGRSGQRRARGIQRRHDQRGRRDPAARRRLGPWAARLHRHQPRAHAAAGRRVDRPRDAFLRKAHGWSRSGKRAPRTPDATRPRCAGQRGRGARMILRRNQVRCRPPR